MEYLHFKTGIPGIIPPDCSELIPPPPFVEEVEEPKPSVEGAQKTAKGVSSARHNRRMMHCDRND